MSNIYKSRPQIYLSGSIEYQKKHHAWRKRMYKALHRKYRVIIPEKADCPFDKGEPEYRSWIHDNTVMKDMINVATAHYFFVKLDKAVFKGAGTISEITTAAWMGKDMIVMLDDIKETSMPTWTLGCLDGAVFVDSIEEAIELYKSRAKEREEKEMQHIEKEK